MRSDRDEAGRAGNGARPSPPGRTKILEALRTLLSEKEFAAITTAEIAGHAGVTEALIYKYFRDKRDLLYEVLAQYLDRYAVQAEMDLKGMVTPRLAPLFLSSMLGVLKANRSIADNPAHPRTEITPTELEELQALAKNLKCLIGFAKLDHLYIFEDKSISKDASPSLPRTTAVRSAFRFVRSARQIITS